jgi:hypothetical protein
MTRQPQEPPEVLGALPHRRPSRRSDKRGPSAPPRPERTASAASTPPHPEGTAEHANSPRLTDSGARREGRPPSGTPRGREIVGTVVQAAAELAEIGLSASARALREAVARLPRP